MAQPSDETPQPAPDFAAQSNVSTAVDSLKSRFMREWSRDPTVEEAVSWNNANKHLTCWNCAQLKAECAPTTSESLPCTRCILLKSQQICTRVIEERRFRVKKIMNLDEETFIALKTTCFQDSRSSPHAKTSSSDNGSPFRNGISIASPVAQLPRLSYPDLADYHSRQRPYSTPSIQLDTDVHTNPSSVPSSKSLSTTPRPISTPEVIDLTGDFDSNIDSSQAKPQHTRHNSNVSSNRNHSSTHLGHGHNSAPASTSHFRHASYQPGSPFGVFASGHPSPPHTRHNFVNGGHSLHSPPSSVRSAYSLDRSSSFEMESSSVRYALPSPPASAPAASMVSGFPPFSRLPPPPTAPVMNIASHLLHSSPTDSRVPRHAGGPLTKEIIFATLHQEAEKIRQVTMMVAQRNQQMRSISEHYERSGLLLVKQEDTQRAGNVTVGGNRDTNAEEAMARLQDELDRSRNLNQGLLRRNEELRNVQRETDELRRAYRDLLQKNETLQRQQKIDNPVRMLKRLQVTSPDCDRRGSDADVMNVESAEGGAINKELDFALSLLNLRREELNDMMVTGTPLQGGAESKNIENGCSVSHHIRRIIAEHTNLQLLIRRLTKTRSDYASERIGKSNMLDLCDELEKQLNQMAQRMLEGLPNGYEGIMGALRSEWHENENGPVDSNGPLSGSDDSPISPASRGPLSPSSTSSQSPDTRIRLKRRRIGDIDVELKR